MTSTSISDLGIAMVIAEGQIAEADRSIALLRRRRQRMLDELEELEDRIRENERWKRELQASLAAASLQAASRAVEPFYGRPGLHNHH